MRISFFADARNVHLRQISSGLAGRGHDVRVVTHKPVDIPGVTVERFHVPQAGLKHPYRWATRRKRYLSGLLERADVAVVLFLHDWQFERDMLDRACIVAMPQGSDIVCPPGEGPVPAELVETRIELLRRVRAVGVTCASFARVVANFADLDESRIECLPVGVDFAHFRGAARTAALHDGLLRVGFFKGFREVYGAKYLVEAAPRVLKTVPVARFEFVGDGPTLDKCRALASGLGIEKFITWMPRRAHRDVPALIRRWDVVAIPSLCESFGVSALESSAMAVPVVASQVGGLPETVCDGRTGLLVPPASPADIAEALIDLLTDAPRRVRMGVVGRAWVQDHFDSATVLDQWETVLRRAVDGAPYRSTSPMTTSMLPMMAGTSARRTSRQT